MKLGPLELRADPVAGDAPHVILVVKAGWFSNDVSCTPDQAREMAAELVKAADVAEGK